jgi:hypothetical protein
VKLPLLLEEVRVAAQREPDGMVKGITLNSLLQLMEWERKNATLTVRSREGIGLIYVKGGQLIHAAFKDLEGIEAAYQILAWERPQIEFVDTCKVHATIDMPLAEVLLNAAFLKDTHPGGP